MFGASLPSTSWEPPVLFKVLFLASSDKSDYNPKLFPTCYQYFLLVSLLTDQTYGLVAIVHCLHVTLEINTTQNSVNKLRQRSRESRSSEKKNVEIILSMLDCKTVVFFSKSGKKSLKRGVRVLCARSAQATQARRACEARAKKPSLPSLALCFQPRCRPFV